MVNVGLRLWVNVNRHHPSFNPMAAESFCLTPTIYYDYWYRGEIKIENCSTWNHVEGCVYFLAPLKWVVLIFIAGENSVGNNNYEQLAQLNSQIETKHIEIQTNNKMQHLELSYPSLVVCNPLPGLFGYSLPRSVLKLKPLSLSRYDHVPWWFISWKTRPDPKCVRVSGRSKPVSFDTKFWLFYLSWIFFCTIVNVHLRDQL